MNDAIKRIVIFMTKCVPDKLYLKCMYRIVTGKRLNLKNPTTFNEKLQWLKLYYRKPEFTDMVDKYEVRKYISQLIGEKYLVPLIGVWNSFDEINFSDLPNKFVLKCTHDCDGIVICKNKKELDIRASRKRIKSCLRRNFYYQGREWPYKNVKPRLIVEKYINDSNSDQLTDYKIFCFNGIPKIIQVDYDRFSGHKRQFFDTDWNRLDLSFHFPSDNSKTINKPSLLNDMLCLAKKLSSGFPHLRTDFYIVDDKILVGEMTFFHGTGMGKWTPESFDKLMGNWLTLPPKYTE